MKVLSLTQPWAQLVVIGSKTIETRSWKTNYRGILAIHAAKRYPRDARSFSRNEAACDLGRHGLTGFLPLGAIIGQVLLIDIWSTEKMLAWWKETQRRTAIPCPVGTQEQIYGDYSPGRFAWRLHSPILYSHPIPARGSLGLWEWDEEERPLTPEPTSGTGKKG